LGIEWIIFFFFLIIFVLLALGLPLCFVLGGTAVLFLFFTWGPAALYVVVTSTWNTMGQFILLAVPLYLFMAFILERAGVAEDLYDMMYLWFGPVRGGLAVGTIIICTIFTAMRGITGTATVMFLYPVSVTKTDVPLWA
jgi:TRAP-type mannitol/chloroaromatic compound transport system permease large subunit